MGQHGRPEAVGGSARPGCRAEPDSEAGTASRSITEVRMNCTICVASCEVTSVTYTFAGLVQPSQSLRSFQDID